MSHGCGCQSGILKYFKPPYSDYFYVPCCIHDDDYDKGDIPRIEADKKLFLGCIKTIYKRENNPWKISWLTFISLLYYIAVRILGELYYEYTV